MGNISIVTAILIAANGLISYKGFNDYSFFEKYKFGGNRAGQGNRYPCAAAHHNPSIAKLSREGII